jgi:carbonic anhydrase
MFPTDRFTWLRRALGVTAFVSTLVVTNGGPLAADAGSDPPSPSGYGGASALTRLRLGNGRFVADASEALPITSPRRAALAQGQSPFATVLSCADSRVPPEVIFHTGLGDLFVVRSAAHVTDRAVLATLEYGVDRLHTPLLVVMGHESCGIVKAALDSSAAQSSEPNLDYLLKSLRPAVSRAASQANDVRLRAAILANVEETINQLLDTSAIIKRLAETQKLTLVGGYYELATGRVHFSEPVHLIARPAQPAPTRQPPASPASRVPPSATKASDNGTKSTPAPATPAKATSTDASKPAASAVPLKPAPGSRVSPAPTSTASH